MNNLDTFGNRLTFARKFRKLTQKEVAKKAGIEQGTLSGLETGKSTSTSSAIPLSKALDVSVDWLIDGSGEMLPASPINAPHYRVIEATDSDPSLRIPYIDVRGSCGGGADNGYNDLMSKGYLIIRY